MGCQNAAKGPNKVLPLLLERGHPTDPNPALLPPQKEGHHHLGMYVSILRANKAHVYSTKWSGEDLSLTIVDVSPPAC